METFILIAHDTSKGGKSIKTLRLCKVEDFFKMPVPKCWWSPRVYTFSVETFPQRITKKRLANEFSSYADTEIYQCLIERL